MKGTAEGALAVVGGVLPPKDGTVCRSCSVAKPRYFTVASVKECTPVAVLMLSWGRLATILSATKDFQITGTVPANCLSHGAINTSETLHMLPMDD